MYCWAACYVTWITVAKQVENMIYSIKVNPILLLQYVQRNKFTVWISFQLLLTVSMAEKYFIKNYSNITWKCMGWHTWRNTVSNLTSYSCVFSHFIGSDKPQL